MDAVKKQIVDKIIAERLARKMEDIWPIDVVLDIAKTQLSLLPSHIMVSIEQLIPHDIYVELSTGERSHIGRYISYLVSIELLQLDRLDPTGDTKRYLTQ
jgi:hypothetical protein